MDRTDILDSFQSSGQVQSLNSSVSEVAMAGAESFKIFGGNPSRPQDFFSSKSSRSLVIYLKETG